MPSWSADGQMMVWYSGCFLAKIPNPSCVFTSSISMTPPGPIADAACCISNTTFLAVCRLSWMNTPTWPTSVTTGGSRCLLVPSTYVQRGRHASVTAAPVCTCRS
jgi:hypothetical protein